LHINSPGTGGGPDGFGKDSLLLLSLTGLCLVPPDELVKELFLIGRSALLALYELL
jgi:hypothetical protein